MRVREVMDTRVMAAKANATCVSLAKEMVSGRVNGLPVIDEQDCVVGVVTEFDLLKVLLLGNGGLSHVVKDVMTPQPVCVDVEHSVDHAIYLMSEHDMVQIPVTSQGRLVGTMSRRDILRAYIAEESEIFAVTQSFDD